MGTRPLEKSLWAGAVDPVGGDILAWLTRTMMYGGCIAAFGSDRRHRAPHDRAAVHPARREAARHRLGDVPDGAPHEVWRRLATDMKPAQLRSIATEITLDDLPTAFDTLLKGAATREVRRRGWRVVTSRWHGCLSLRRAAGRACRCPDAPYHHRRESDAEGRSTDPARLHGGRPQRLSPPLTVGRRAGRPRSSSPSCSEDPDAGNPPPFVHWVIYKIPRDARRDCPRTSRSSRGDADAGGDRRRRSRAVPASGGRSTAAPRRPRARCITITSSSTRSTRRSTLKPGLNTRGAAGRRLRATSSARASLSPPTSESRRARWRPSSVMRTRSLETGGWPLALAPSRRDA